jgi:hypothetical protein
MLPQTSSSSRSSVASSLTRCWWTRKPSAVQTCETASCTVSRRVRFVATVCSDPFVGSLSTGFPRSIRRFGFCLGGAQTRGLPCYFPPLAARAVCLPSGGGKQGHRSTKNQTCIVPVVLSTTINRDMRRGVALTLAIGIVLVSGVTIALSDGEDGSAPTTKLVSNLVSADERVRLPA